jgi:hypothetical protein
MAKNLSLQSLSGDEVEFLSTIRALSQQQKDYLIATVVTKIKARKVTQDNFDYFANELRKLA